MAGSEIIKSTNPTLSYLLNNKNLLAKFAVVDSGGSGHFTSIGDAVNGGAVYIYVRNGTYNISSDITFDFQTIIGESTEGVILNLTDASLLTQTTTESIESYPSQEISVSLNSTRVSKVLNPTVFTDVTSDGTTKIILDSFFTRVETIIDDDNLDLTIPFNGNSSINLNRWSMFNTTTEAFSIENMTINTIYTSARFAIKLEQFGSTIRNINFLSKDIYTTFVGLGYSHAVAYVNISNNNFEGGLDAISAVRSYCCNISNNRFQLIQNWCFSGDELNIYNSFVNNIYSGCKSGLQLKGKGNNVTRSTFEMIDEYAIYYGDVSSVPYWDSATKCEFKNCGNGTNAVIYSITNNVRFSNNEFRGCEKCIEINVTASGTASQIKGNTFEECKNEIIVDGRNNLIKENFFKDSVSGSTNIATANEYNVISGNTFIDCTSNFNTASNTFFSQNIFEYTTYATITITGANFSLTENIFKNVGIISDGNAIAFRDNKFEGATSGFILVIKGDKNLISNNIFTTSSNGIDIQATADKTHVLENKFVSITTTNVQDNGTNTVQSNNI